MQQQINFLDLLSGKTFQEPLVATKDATSKPSSKRFVKSGGGSDLIIPLPPKGRWLPAGCVVGDGYSLAWRILDAQYYGVPQRRKRIYLVADFDSERAGEIQFVGQSVRWDSKTCAETWQRIAAHAAGSALGGGQCL